MPILVTYASKHGSTQDIAERIATTLRQLRHEVIVQPVHAVENLAAYDGVILGNAIY